MKKVYFCYLKHPITKVNSYKISPNFNIERILSTMAVGLPKEQFEEPQAPIAQPQDIIPDGTESAQNVGNFSELREGVEGTTELPNGGWAEGVWEPGTWKNQNS
jgi:hypothetical protein